jgi:hypothetical protein
LEYINIAKSLKIRYESIIANKKLGGNPVSRSINSQQELKTRLIHILECLESIDGITDLERIMQKVQISKQDLKFVIDQTQSNVISLQGTVDFSNNSKLQSMKKPLGSDHRLSIVAEQMKAGFSNLVGLLDLNHKTGVKCSSASVDVEDRPFDDFTNVHGKDNEKFHLVRSNSSLTKSDNNSTELANYPHNQ